jgi:phospholipase C
MGESNLPESGKISNVSSRHSTVKPAVAMLGPLLFEVHKQDNDAKKEGELYCSYQGADSQPDKWKKKEINTGWKTNASPALASIKDRLCLVWKAGKETDIWYAYIDRDKNVSSSKKLVVAGLKVMTKVSPVVISFPNIDVKKKISDIRLFVFFTTKVLNISQVAWTKRIVEGKENKDINNDAWGASYVSSRPMITEIAPSVVVHNDTLYIAYVGTDHKIRIGYMEKTTENVNDECTSINGSCTYDSPSLFTANGALCIAWTQVNKDKNKKDVRIVMVTRFEYSKSTGQMTHVNPEPLFVKDGKPVAEVEGAPHYGLPAFVEKFKGGLFGIWNDTRSKNELKISNFAPNRVEHVFLLMLENRSFDHMLGYSGITDAKTGKRANTLSGGEVNYYNGKEFRVSNTAPFKMGYDPGHEFEDTYEQLLGQNAKFTPNHSYPSGGVISNSGFVANVARKTNNTSIHGDVMKAYDPAHVPIITRLAKEFAVCDAWFSSLPGPTAPNRFFALAATSGGVDYSPSQLDLLDWMGFVDAGLVGVGAAGPLVGALGGGVTGAVVGSGPGAAVIGSVGATLGVAASALAFTGYVGKKMYQFFKSGSVYNGIRFDNGSIFGRIKHPKSRIFSDWSGEKLGCVPMSYALSDVRWTHMNSLDTLMEILKKDSFATTFTLIEPNYGNPTDSGGFAGGTSQHPIDDVRGGEGLIKKVYEAIRSSPKWKNSVLIITYDEHGGFYDHQVPPTATPPGDSNVRHKNGFNFDRLGVRVPAVIVSPWIRKGTVDSTVYDHTSIAATLTQLFGMKPLTARDKVANNITGLLSLEKPRLSDSEALMKLPEVPYDAKAKSAKSTGTKAPLAPSKSAAKKKLPERGNVWLFLFMAAKIHNEIGNVSREELFARITAIRTVGEAYEFANEAAEMLRASMEAKK